MSFGSRTQDIAQMGHNEGLAATAAALVETFGLDQETAAALAPRARHGTKVWGNLCVLEYQLGQGFDRDRARSLLEDFTREKRAAGWLSVAVHADLV